MQCPSRPRLPPLSSLLRRSAICQTDPASLQLPTFPRLHSLPDNRPTNQPVLPPLPLLASRTPLSVLLETVDGHHEREPHPVFNAARKRGPFDPHGFAQRLVHVSS